MGSGSDLGFNPFPDWSVYALLQVWKDQSAAALYRNQHPLALNYQKKAEDVWQIGMEAIKAKGQWSQRQPFSIREDNMIGEGQPVAVITRATIKPKHLIRFWKTVPDSRNPLYDKEGLIYTKGIGEIPVVQMATFSLWKNLDAIKQYAYQSKEHQEAIRKTREYDWYAEEMFVRFRVVNSQGSWKGEDRLPQMS